jgi:TfoX/Sxy family transcriptional regulator of competence genes
MASEKQFVEFITGHMADAGNIQAKAMFGEYVIYSDSKLFALICENKLFIKPTEAGRAFLGTVIEASPYPGAKPCFLIEEKLDDSAWLSELARITVKELPEPKPKKKKK